jgi:ribose/xylose/arabinose/galactoside ABC-type transport system permease subunit
MANQKMTAEQAREAPTRRQLVRRQAGTALRAYGMIIAVVALSLFFQVQNPAFLEADNVLVIVRSMASIAMIAFAQLFVIILGEIDLSVGAVYGLAATVLATFWLGAGNAPFELPFIVALVLALSVGLLAGASNAFFTTVFGMPSFVPTLGMLSIAQGTELLLSNAASYAPQYNLPPPPQGEVDIFRALGATVLPFGIPIQVLWLAVFAALFWVVRHRSLFGFRLLAIGGNQAAARTARLPILKYKWIVFILSGLMAAIAGILDFSYVGSVGPGSGLSLTFPVIAAVVIGGASLMGGRGTIFGTLVGATLLAIIRNGLAIMGVGAYGGLIVTGVVTIGAVALDRIAHGKRAE